MQLTRHHQRFPGFHYPEEVRAVLAAYTDDEPVLLTEIAARTDLRLTTVAQIAATLTTQNLLVAEPEDEETLNPWTRRDRINPDGAYSIGITVDALLVKMAILNLGRKVCHSASCLTAGQTIDDIMGFIVAELKVATEGKGVPLSRLEGICLCETTYASPPIQAVAEHASALTIWDLQRELSFRYRVPIFIEDQIVAVAHGKAFIEGTRATDSFIYVMLNR